MLTQLAENRKQMHDCSDMCIYDYKVRDCRKRLCLSTGPAETRLDHKNYQTRVELLRRRPMKMHICMMYVSIARGPSDTSGRNHVEKTPDQRNTSRVPISHH